MRIGGLDVGTTGCKISVFEQTGECLYVAYREYEREEGKEGREFWADNVWNSVVAVIREAVEAVGSPDAIGVTSFGESFAALDEEDQLLFPSLLYTDPRGTEECARLTEALGEESLTEATGICPHSMYSLPKIMYLKNADPEKFSRVRRILLMQDFLVYRLSGVAQIDYSLASRTMAFDVRKKTWHAPALAFAGIDESLLSRPVPSGTAAGRVTPAAARLTGLSETTLIVTGAQDQIAAALGASTFEAGAAVDGCGTVECITPLFDRPFEGGELHKEGYPLVPYALDGYYVTYALSYTGGASLKWFRDNLAVWEKHEAERLGKNVYAILDAACPKTPTDLLVMPHFGGAATPHMDPFSRAAIVGLTLGTKREELYRAIMEGSAYEMAIAMEHLEKRGMKIDRLCATGGGAASPIWLSIKADVWNRPVSVLDGTEAGAAGTAMLTGVALGIYPSLRDAAKIFVRPGKTYLPNPENVAYYQKQLEKYRKMYHAVRPLV